MTFEECKRWLNRAYKIEKLIKYDKEEIERLENLINTGMGIDYLKDRVQTSLSNEAPFERKILEVVEIKNRYKQRVLHQEIIKNEIREAIESLDDNVQKEILILRHIKFLDWAEISNIVNYSSRQCLRLYYKAISNLSKKIIDNT